MLARPFSRALGQSDCLCLIRRLSGFRRHNSSSAQLPSDTEHARSNMSKALTSRMDKFQTSLLFAGQRLNDLTGYSGIERLKKQIEMQEQEVLSCVQRVKDAKKQYEEAIRVRSESQREVNELLQRKSSWSGVDLERFTTLFRDDHSNSQNEERWQRTLGESDLKVDQARTELGNMILARYHEEQIWSDKIRRASTWGTWGLMGFNIVLFVLVQLGLEPWKRRRLVGSFEEKVRQVVQEEREAREQQAMSGSTSVDTIEDVSFLTDADHAAFDTFQHDYVSSEPSDSKTDDNLTVDKQHLVASDDIVPSGMNLEHPRTGTSSMLLMPLSIHSMRQSLSILINRLGSFGLVIHQSLRSTFKNLFSPARSHLRVEDVTSACFVSGLVGIAIGMLL